MRLFRHFFGYFLSRMTKIVAGKIKGKRCEWETMCKQKSLNGRLSEGKNLMSHMKCKQKGVNGMLSRCE